MATKALNQSRISAHPVSERKRRRRHTRVHLDSLRPKTATLTPDSITQCPKCQGLVNVDAGEQLGMIVIRCLNCGWQPHHQARFIKETEEARDIRSQISQFVAEGDWAGFPVGW